mgnify:FL=1
MTLLNAFLFFSILGFSGEYLGSLILNHQKETLLLGPWMPIYGLGFLFVHATHQFLKCKNLAKKKELIFCYIISVLVLSLCEEIGGLLTYHFFQKNYWDYTNLPLSIGPYINVFISLGWGFLALIIEYLVYPKVKPFFQKIPKLLTIIIFILLLLDHLICFHRHNLLYTLNLHPF